MLRLHDLCSGYGRFDVLHNVSLEVDQGATLAILGPNGAGKTTLAKTIIGLISSRRGTVEIDGQSLTELPAHKVVEAGVSLLPEGRQILPNLTVRENLLIGGHTCRDRNVRLQEVYAILPLLSATAGKLGTQLSGGQQQLLALGRALMSRPRYLVLDEPSLGLSPVMIKEVADRVEELRRREGPGMIIIEQNLGLAARLADHALVLRRGRVAATFPKAELTAEKVFETYVR